MAVDNVEEIANNNVLLSYIQGLIQRQQAAASALARIEGQITLLQKLNVSIADIARQVSDLREQMERDQTASVEGRLHLSQKFDIITAGEQSRIDQAIAGDANKQEQKESK